MIAWLQGRLIHKDMETVVLDVQGVGYRLFIPLNTFYHLPETGQEVSLKVHTVVREDAIELFGFLTDAERQAFLSLIGVAGIGPRLAKNILSGIRPDELAEAIMAGDGERLRAIPGVGKRMAERILVELQGKLLTFASQRQKETLEEPGRGGKDDLRGSVLSALLNLGYKRSEIYRVLQTARGALQGPVTVQSWVKEALKQLSN